MKEPALGAHLVSPRRLYTHHGIYVGSGKVVHYAGLADGLKTGPVEEADLSMFEGGHGWSAKIHPQPRFSPPEVVARAKSRIGEQLYSVLSCNCEHFAHWAINDDHLSPQVDKGTVAGSGAMAAAAGKAAISVVPALAAATTVATSGAGLMSGLATVGGVIGGGAAVGVGLIAAAPAMAAAALVNNTVLKDTPSQDDDERDARAIGRKVSVAGAAAAGAGAVATVAAVGIPGLSAVGITTGLAGVGATVGGGMAAGVVIAAAAPVAVAVALGVGVYKLARFWKKK
jgi:Lecithin retinol acyltransferase